MSYSITEIDGVQINPDTKRFPIEVHAEQHQINGPEHEGILDDSQIPEGIMRDLEHHLDPHTMIIDGRDVSVDGAKLDTIEGGAEVNNLTDMQAHDLTSGIHTNWHNHDNFYYRKSELQLSGSAEVAWGNLINVPASFAPSAHDHNDIYYTKTLLDNGQLDSRYFTESEIASLLANKSDVSHLHDSRYYLKGEVDTLLGGKSDTSHLHDDRYYTESEVDTALALKSDATHLHDSRYYLKGEVDTFLAGKSDTTHLHDDRYYTESEMDTALALKSDATHLHDDRYFTESEITTLLVNKSDVGHEHDDLYYTKDETSAFLSQKSNIDHLHDSRYYQKSEVTTLLASKSDVSHLHDDRYYTESEIITLLSGKSDTTHLHNDIYYTKSLLDNGQLDSRYYTEPEIDAMVQSASIGVRGAVNTFSDLPTEGLETGQIYIVRQTIDSNEEGFYRWNGTTWEFLVNNTGVETHNDLGGLNVGDFKHLTQAEYADLTDGGETLLHIHDGRYFTETESDARFAPISHNHDSIYYTKTQLDAGQLNTLYYTKTNLQTGGQASVAWGNLTGVPTTFTPAAHNQSATTITSGTLAIARGGTSNTSYTSAKFVAYDGTKLASTAYDSTSFATASHNHDTVYYLKSQVDTLLAGKSDTTHLHDDRYFTESEITTGYYTKTNLQTGGQASVAWGNLTGVPTTFTPSEHSHDDRYFTESEITTLLASKSDTTHLHDDIYYTKTLLDGGQLDSRYFTESEVTTALALKSDTSHLHDDRYYTESEITTLLANKSDVGHIHDDRYFTEGEITALLALKSSIDHLHDDRYYTESEITTMLSGKSDTTHLHDDRYFTELEIGGTTGAGLVGLATISGISSTTVQGALGELNTRLNSFAQNLDQAYEAGRIITAESGAVKIDTVSATNAPLELTNKEVAPSAGLSAGQIAVINNVLYIYDGSRSKWLSPSKSFTCGKTGGTKNQYLRFAGSVVPTATTGFVAGKNGTILSATISSTTATSNANGMCAYLRLNGVNVATLIFNSSGIATLTNINVDFDYNDSIAILMGNNSTDMQNCIAMVEYAWRI